MELNNTQLNWLLNTFFENEEFHGWKNIALELIKKGKCVTTKLGSNIWIGGVGNFIKEKVYDGNKDLIELTFDINAFCSSENKYFLYAYENILLKTQKKCETTLKELEDYNNFPVS